MSYIIYHPGTGTIIGADECYLVNTADLPSDFEDWERFFADQADYYSAYEIAKGKELL